MKRNILIPGLLLCLFIATFTITHGADDTFYVEEINADGTTRVIDQAKTYIVAKASYDAHVANTNNIQIRQGDTVWKMKYGVLLFQTSDTCDYNVTYQSDNGSGYTNGCYGIDAAYMGSSSPGYLDFYLSGVYGSAQEGDAALMPIETAPNVSNYRVEDNKLYHQIKTDMSHPYYASVIYLGDAPDYLTNDQEYYSYDGHYFYPYGGDFSGFHEMCDDLQDGTHSHAINADEPFYHYFQYASHRTATNYSEEELRTYIEDQLHIKGSLTTYHSIGTSYHGILTQSLLKNNIAPFLQYQDQFGANAMTMLALAMNESATGRSYLAYSRNNLFGHAAFDSAVEENASRYDSVSKSVYSHALHYLQNGYFNPENRSWHGAYFGNKASGMNVSYASDPYWGEKAAQYYVRMDEAMGGKDWQAHPLAVPTYPHEISIYKEANTNSEVLYTTGSLSDFAFLVLESDKDGFYKIQSDPALNTGDSYSFSESVGYIQQSDVRLIGEAPKHSPQRYTIRFDAKEGHFEDGSSSLNLSCRENQIPSVVAPIQEGWLFMGWNEEVNAANGNRTYEAQYAKIQDIELTPVPKQEYHVGEQLDVSGGILSITLAQDVVKNIPLDSTMVYGYDPETSGKQTIHIRYQGATLSYPIEVKQEDAAVQSSTLPRIQSILENYSIFDALSEETTNELLAIKEAMDYSGIPDLSNDGIRLLDTFIQKAYGSSLQIKVSDDGSGVSVSGLTIAAPLSKPSIFPQSINFSLSKGIANEKEELLKQVALGNGYTLDTCFSLSMSGYDDEAELPNRLLIAYPKNQELHENAHYMLLRYENDEVYQVPISQSETLLSFTTDRMGDYALAYRPSNQTYNGNDIVENNSVETNGWSLMDFLFWVGIGGVIIACIVFTIMVRRKRKHQKNQIPPQKDPRKGKKQRRHKGKKETMTEQNNYQIPAQEPPYQRQGQDPYYNDPRYQDPRYRQPYSNQDPYGNYPNYSQEDYNQRR